MKIAFTQANFHQRPGAGRAETTGFRKEAPQYLFMKIRRVRIAFVKNTLARSAFSFFARSVNPARARVAARGRASVIPLGWLHVLFWAGLRGAVSVALVLSLPVDLPNRGLIAAIVYGVVLFTLLAQGSTSGVVIRRALGRGHPPGRRPAASTASPTAWIVSPSQ